MKKVKIVVIEDHDSMMELYSAALPGILNHLGYTEGEYEVSVNKNGASGLASYSDKRRVDPVDFLISDNDLPDMKGVDILGKISLYLTRKDGKIPFILASGNLNPDDKQYAESMGAYTLDKPFRLEKLEEIIQKHLGRPAEVKQHK